MYKVNGWLSWDYVKKSKAIFTATTWLRGFFNFLFAYPNVLVLFSVRILAVISLWWATFYLPKDLWLLHSLIYLLTILGLLLGWRHTNSNNGADQVSNIILVSVCIASLEKPGSFIPLISILFIACQSELSYLTSGFLKLIHPGWRDGTSLKDIFSTEAFGNQKLKNWLEIRPDLFSICSYIVFLCEIILGFAFLFPPVVCIWMLAAGFLFHISVAAIMGLNTFVWSFAATYPAIYFISESIHQAGQGLF